MRRVLVPVVLLLLGAAAVHAQGRTTDGEVRHARNLPELIASFLFTFDGILTEEEKAVVNYRDPEGMRETHPELYEKISQNIQHWTEDWIEYATEKLDSLPADDLLSSTKLRNAKTYVRERTLVELICDRLAQLRKLTEEQALEIVLETYITGDERLLAEAFGNDTWEAVVELSWTPKWRKSDLKKTLAQSTGGRDQGAPR